MSKPTALQSVLGRRRTPSAWNEAPQVGRNHWQRCRRIDDRAPSFRVPRCGAPPLDEFAQDSSVESGPPAVECLVDRRHGALVTMHVGKTESRRSRPMSLGFGHRHRLDREDRFVPSYWPTKPSVCSQPASAASAISRLVISPAPCDSVRCQLSWSPGRRSAAGTKLSGARLPSPATRGGRQSHPAGVPPSCGSATPLPPLCFTATICVTPYARNLRPPLSSTSRRSDQTVRRAHECVVRLAR